MMMGPNSGGGGGGGGRQRRRRARLPLAIVAAAAAAAILAWAAALDRASAEPSKALSDWLQGSTQHFGGPEDEVIDPFNPMVSIGGCSYGEMDPKDYPFYNILTVHPESQLMSGKTMDGCGACFEIQCADSLEKCNNGPLTNSVVAMLAGTCGGGCGGTKINLHVFAFDKLAPIRLGNIGIRLRQVECAPTRNLLIRIKVYRVEQGGYIKLVVLNVPLDGGLRAVELRASSEEGSWTRMENLFGAAWEASDLPLPPMDVRLTNTNGEQLILKEIIKEAGFVGNALSDIQFSGAPTFEPEIPEGSPTAGQGIPLNDSGGGVLPSLPGGTFPGGTPTIPGLPIAQPVSTNAPPNGGIPPKLPGAAFPSGTLSVPMNTSTQLVSMSPPDMQFPQTPFPASAVIEVQTPGADKNEDGVATSLGGSAQSIQTNARPLPSNGSLPEVNPGDVSTPVVTIDNGPIGKR